MNIDYTANNTFARVHQDINPYIFIRGPVGSGKSSGCILHCFLNALMQSPDSSGIRRSKYAVVRATYPALKSTVVRSWIDWFRSMLKIVYDTPIRGTINFKHPIDGTKIEMEIIFVALDREEEVNKLQSLELTGAHINEAAEIHQSIFNMLTSRIDRYPPPKDGGASRPFILLDYNSPDTEHWLYRLAEEKQPEGCSFYVQPPALIWDGEAYKINPNADNIENLSAKYYANMAMVNDEDWINVYVLNNYGTLRKGRPVYKLYNDKVHAAEHVLKPMRGIPLIIGIDVGLTPAAAFCQLAPTGQLVILDEIVTENTSITEFASILWSHIRNKFKGLDFECILDPASVARSMNDKQSAFDILIKAGLPCRVARTNNALARREAVNYFLQRQIGGSPGLLLSPACRVIRKGFISEYKFSKIASSNILIERYKEKPEKNIYSHVHDGVQYACVELSEGRLRKNKIIKRQNYQSCPADLSAGY